MKFNEDLQSNVNWEDVLAEQYSEKNPYEITNQEKINRMKSWMYKKHHNLDLSNYNYLFQLYRLEAELEFSENVYKRFMRVWRFGEPKVCPINKFIQQPTLF